MHFLSMGSVSFFVFVLVRPLLVDDRYAGARACAKRAAVIVRVLRDRFADRIKRRCSAMINAFINDDVPR